MQSFNTSTEPGILERNLDQPRKPNTGELTPPQIPKDPNKQQSN